MLFPKTNLISHLLTIIPTRTVYNPKSKTKSEEGTLQYCNETSTNDKAARGPAPRKEHEDAPRFSL